MKKITIKDVEKIINDLGFILVSKEYLGNKKAIIICDDFGYYYSCRLNDIKNGHLPRKFYKSNPYTIQNIKLWCKEENKKFKLISDKYIEDNKSKLNWLCLKEKCGEAFESTWNTIYRGDNCPFCSGTQVGLSNCLATLNQKLASEWHSTLNGDLTPYDVTLGSNKYAWWECKDNPKHKWYAQINSRNNRNSGCPYCDGQRATEENNLLICNPKLLSEWNYNKNFKRPEEYCPNANQDVWWICKECEHEWKAQINSRNRKNGKATGCPACSKSHGEKECKRIFDLRNIYYIPQKQFSGLVGLGGGLLSYDFYIPKYNLLIEYQGEQHEKYILGFHKSMEDFEKQVEHDRRKCEYVLNNKYNFLEIWYWDFDNIETILDEYFKQLEV